MEGERVGHIFQLPSTQQKLTKLSTCTRMVGPNRVSQGLLSFKFHSVNMHAPCDVLESHPEVLQIELALPGMSLTKRVPEDERTLTEQGQVALHHKAVTSSVVTTGFKQGTARLEPSDTPSLDPTASTSSFAMPERRTIPERRRVLRICRTLSDASQVM